MIAAGPGEPGQGGRGRGRDPPGDRRGVPQGEHGHQRLLQPAERPGRHRDAQRDRRHRQLAPREQPVVVRTSRHCMGTVAPGGFDERPRSPPFHSHSSGSPSRPPLCLGRDALDRSRFYFWSCHEMAPGQRHLPDHHATVPARRATFDSRMVHLAFRISSCSFPAGLVFQGAVRDSGLGGPRILSRDERPGFCAFLATIPGTISYLPWRLLDKEPMLSPAECDFVGLCVREGFNKRIKSGCNAT